MADFYLITENFFNNRADLNTDDRDHYYTDLDAPTITLEKKILVLEQEKAQRVRDFHLIGELIVSNEIAQIISSVNPYLCDFLSSNIVDDKNTIVGYYILSIKNILSCVDFKKSEITENPFYEDDPFIDSLYINLEQLNSIECYKKNLFIVKEVPKNIIVSKELGEKLSDYVDRNPKTSLVVKPISDDGKVPELY